MKCINKVILVGRAGRDADLRETKTGRSVANFSLATETFWKKKDGDLDFQSRTEWHRIVAWGDLAERVKRQVYKGAKVYVEGVIKYEKYKDKAGLEKLSTEVQIHDFSLLGAQLAVSKQIETVAESKLDPPQLETDVPIFPAQTAVA